MGTRVLVLGGVSSSLINFRGPLLRLLKVRGHEVMAAAQPETGRETVSEELAAMGVSFHPIEIMRSGLNPWDDLRTWRGICRLLSRCRPEVLIAYTAKPVIYGGMAARSLGGIRFFPMITGLGYAFTEVGGMRRRLVRGVLQRLYRQGLQAADATIFQNPDDQALFHELRLIPPSGRSIRVYGSGVDRCHFIPTPVPSSPSFLMLSRLVADKGVYHYVEAARWVKQQRPDAQFRLAGDFDPNPAGIGRKQVAAWMKEGVIEYLSSLSDVRPALAASRCFVLPTYYREGVPRSVLEAMATGRPIITTDAPGCRDTVEHGVNGFLVKPRSSEALADAMLHLLQLDTNAIEAMGRESLRLVEERFDVDRVNRDILGVTGL